MSCGFIGFQQMSFPSRYVGGGGGVCSYKTKSMKKNLCTFTMNLK